MRRRHHVESSTSWRAPVGLQLAWGLVMLSGVFFLPESPRWLVYNDRREEGLQVLAKINGADENDADVQLQYREILDTLEYEKTDGQSMGYKEMVRTPQNRKRLALCLSIAPLAMLTGSNVIT